MKHPVRITLSVVLLLSGCQTLTKQKQKAPQSSVNTVSDADVVLKIVDGQKIMTALHEIFSPPHASDTDMPAAPTISETDESSRIRNMLASGGPIENCETALAQVNSIFADAEKYYRTLATAIVDANSFEKKGVRLEKLPADAYYATRLGFRPKDPDKRGLDASGIIAAGASDRELRLFEESRLTVDLHAAFGSIATVDGRDQDLPIEHTSRKAAIIVALESQTIEYSVDFLFKRDRVNPSTTSVSSKVTINGGNSEKLVKQVAQMTSDTGQTLKTEITAKLLPTGNVEVSGTVGRQAYGYRIARSGTECSIQKR